MDAGRKYKKTLLACYLGFITQAISANFAPLLFLTFYRTYGISFSRLALISTCFYVTQLVIDFVCARFVDKVGYRKCVVLSEVLSAAGLAGLSVLPDRLSPPFAGILLCTVVYAVGSGLIEVLCSPIVEACPFENKEGTMSLLHSFYCWGSVGVILGSTLFFALFGIERWRVLACLWALVPLCGVYFFATCPMETLVEDGKGMTVGQLFQTGQFWLLILLMVCAGSSEAAIAQWASAFAESALGVSKAVGDLAGPCGFAACMGISRTLFSRLGGKGKLTAFMAISGLMCLGGYLLAGVAGIPVLGLAGCMLSGFSVGIMWPGSISISSSLLPTGGTAMFALLALAGDLGAAVGPALVGAASQLAGEDLRVGILSGIAFPVLLAVIVLIIGRDPRLRPGGKGTGHG